MKLKVAERLVFPTLRPAQSDLTTQIVFRDILAKVAIDQEEMEKIGMKTVGPNMQWNKDAPELEVRWTQAELDLLYAQIKELDKAKKITPQLTDLAVKISGYTLCKENEEEDKKDGKEPEKEQKEKKEK